MWSDNDSGAYELVQIAKSVARETEAKRGVAASVAFVGRNRFAALDGRMQTVWSAKIGAECFQIAIKNFANEITKKLPAPVNNADRLFEAPGGLLLVRGDDSIVLYDPGRKKTIASADIAGVRSVVWSPDSQRVALLTKTNVYIADRNLMIDATVHEAVHVKSGVWDGLAFVYTTLAHIKYVLPSSDSGTIGTLPEPLYIAAILDGNLIAIRRDLKFVKQPIDATEVSDYSAAVLLIHVVSLQDSIDARAVR